MTRVGISARVFGLAAALGLAASGGVVPSVASTFLLLCVIAALACVPQPTATAQRVVPIIEGAVVGLTLTTTGLVDEALGSYLIVPALIAGLVGGPVVVALTILAELATMAAVPIVRLEPQSLPGVAHDALPWLLFAVGIGLLGTWIRRLSGAPTDVDREGYVAAHRLLDELRVVSRRLSSGLDPVVLATTLLDDCLVIVTDGRGAVLARTDGGLFTSLAQHLDGTAPGVVNDPIVLQCWRTSEPAHQPDPLERSDYAAGPTTFDVECQPADTSGRHRWALPLRVGTTMVGVLVLDVEYPLDAAALEHLQALLDERALPLDTALLFDEVRRLATVEERHRLAREIHDGVAQEIASLGYLVDDLEFADDDARAARVVEVRGELTRIVDDLRLSIFDLRSEVSRTAGLGAVLADYFRELGTRSGSAVHLSLDETPDRLRLEVEVELLRIVQEAVTNARKHSGAPNLWVTCRVRAPAAELIVEDDGSGVKASGRAAGFGLSIMRERAHRIGADLRVTERAKGGTRVSVRLNAPERQQRLATHGAETAHG